MPDDEGLREELAEALLAQTMLAGAQVRAVFDALLPVVERYAARRAAEALREAADELHLNISGREGLYNRADALTAERGEVTDG